MKFRTEQLLPVLLVFAGNAYALDWLLNPEFEFSERYADNIRMQVLPHKTNLVTTFSPSLLAGYLADDNELRAKFDWNELLYSDESALNFSEKIASINHTFHNERWKTNITGIYGYQSSITTFSEIGAQGSSIGVGIAIPRYTRSIAPEVTYQLSERNSLELSGYYGDITYGYNPTNNLGYSPYTSEMANLTLYHKYTDKLTLNGTVGYSIYDTSKSIVQPNYSQIVNNQFVSEPTSLSYSQSSKTLTAQLGFQYSFSEQMIFSAGGGIRNTDTHSINNYNVANFDCSQLASGLTIARILKTPYSCSTINSTTPGSVYNASLRRDFESGNVNISYNQQLNPSSTGSQQQTQSFSLSSNYDFDDRTKFGFTGSYTQTTAVAGFLSNVNNYAYLNRDLIAVSPNVQYQWSPDIHLQLTYTYMDQHYILLNQTSTANSVQFQFIYQPQINRQVK
jgi:hypothetical protein